MEPIQSAFRVKKNKKIILPSLTLLHVRELFAGVLYPEHRIVTSYAVSPVSIMNNIEPVFYIYLIIIMKIF